jgi:hypothetical protein
MNIIKSEISACRKTAYIWNILALDASYFKSQAVEVALGRRYVGMVNQCPCCDFAINPENEDEDEDCSLCPLAGFWPSSATAFMCEDKKNYGDDRGIYRMWLIEERRHEMRVLAGKIRNIALQGLEYWQAMKDMNQC